VSRRLRLTLLAAALWLVAAPAHAEPPAESAAFDSIAGGAAKGSWTVGVQAGWPWLGLRGQVGLGAVAPLLEIEAAPGWRLEPSGGLSIKLLRRPHGRLSAEVLLGWQVQTGTLAQRGPSGAARVRVMGIARRVGFWLTVGTRHTLLFDRTRTVSADGTTTDWAARHRWSPHLAGGIAITLHRNVGLEVGLNWHFVDVGTTAISLPGIHAGVHFGGGRTP